MSALKEFLMEYAKNHELNPLDKDQYWARPITDYSEDVNPDADNGDAVPIATREQIDTLLERIGHE